MLDVCLAEEVKQPLKVLLTTKRIQDPDLIPSLIDSDINFGAVKVCCGTFVILSHKHRIINSIGHDQKNFTTPQ